MLLFHLCCIDTYLDDEFYTSLMQESLMYSFCGRNGDFLVRTIIDGAMRAVCNGNRSNWRHVECVSGQVKSINFISEYNPDFKIEYLPNSVEHFEITSSRLQAQIETRMLPAALRKIDVSMNQIFGTFDLTTLPLQIERVCAMENRITDVGSLCHLPATVKYIDMRWNSIKRGTLYFSDIPEGLEELNFRKSGISYLCEVPSRDGDRSVEFEVRKLVIRRV